MSKAKSLTMSNAKSLTTSRRYLIVNADDFGASPGINRGIMAAHAQGIVTSTSMLVDTHGSVEAGVLSRSAPRLSVGLHVDLPAAFFDGSASLEAELERQADRFVELVGGPPTHLDSHRDVHQRPDVLPAFLELAHALGVPLRGHSPTRRLSGFYGQWGGESHPEQVGVESLVEMLGSHVAEGITELICHPGHVDEHLRSSYLHEREAEVATLCDPRIRQALAALRIELASHHDLGRLVGGRT
jgi:chitin disaccharide deacetylase